MAQSFGDWGPWWEGFVSTITERSTCLLSVYFPSLPFVLFFFNAFIRWCLVWWWMSLIRVFRVWWSGLRPFLDDRARSDRRHLSSHRVVQEVD